MSNLTITERDILHIALKRKYTAFTNTADSLCQQLTERGLLLHEGDFQYSITGKGAQAIGQRVIDQPVTPPAPVAMPPRALPTMTEAIVKAYEETLKHDITRDRVNAVVALARLQAAVGAALREAGR